MPTFVIVEFSVVALVVLLLVHAIKHGRAHVYVWFLSFITGSANDAIFMALPFVDNFWQAQACIMLTPRMPLYIPCIYCLFMYTSTVAVWRFQLPKLPEAALTGIMAEMIYAPYDISGIKFTWWTWHDTDAPIRHRILGVPVGSSAWVITFTATFQLLVRSFLLGKRPSEATPSATMGVVLNALLTTPIMMLQMSFFQFISGDAQGLPTVRTLVAVLVVYSIIVGAGFVYRRNNPVYLDNSDYADSIPKIGLLCYFTMLTLLMSAYRPEQHLSTGVHQTVGPCDVYAEDLAGQTRQVYLCADGHTQDWTFDCPGQSGAPHDYTEWYTVCPRPHSNFPLWMSSILALAVVGVSSYWTAFSSTRMKRKTK